MQEVTDDVVVKDLGELLGLTRARIRDNRRMVGVMDADHRTLKAQLAVLERLLRDAKSEFLP
jgi:hypothetical protein